MMRAAAGALASVFTICGFVAAAGFLAGTFLACLERADFAAGLDGVLAGCPLRAGGLAVDAETRAPALGTTCFRATAFFAALLFGVVFRTISFVSL